MSQEWEIEFDKKFPFIWKWAKSEGLETIYMMEEVKSFIRSLIQSQTDANGYDNDGNPIKYGYSGGPDKRPPQWLVKCRPEELFKDALKYHEVIGAELDEAQKIQIKNFCIYMSKRFGVPVVKLPEEKIALGFVDKGHPTFTDFDNGFNQAINLVREELERKGIKWE